MSYLADNSSKTVQVTNYRFDVNKVPMGIQVPYTPDKEHSNGTVYQHSMLGVNVLTNRMVRLADRKLKFALDKTRQSGKDYQPYVKTNRRDAMASVGSSDNRLIDAEYERHSNDIYKALDRLDMAYKSRTDTKGNGIADLGVFTRYLDIALRLLISGSTFDATCHALADTMIADFRSDNFNVAISLPENNSRSKDGKLTDGDRERFQAYDAAIVWISGKSSQIVKIAIVRLDKALESAQS